MMTALMGTKQSNFHIDILFYSQYLDSDGLVYCYPGSVFEGVVNIKVNNPTPVHHIKLVFKASERVNYDAMGWEKSKLNDDRLFAIRTVLWGLPTYAVIPAHDVPILEAGEYSFPFICQMPVINFPPTFQHHLVATSFNMIVCIEKGDGSSPVLSKLWPVRYQPIIETEPIKNTEPFKEETQLTQTILSHVTIPRLAFNILEKTQSIPVTVNFSLNHHPEDQLQPISISHLRVYIKRYYNINYKTFSKSEVMTIAHQDITKLPSTCPCTITMKLEIPDPPHEIPPTLNYSPQLSIEYKLIVSVRIRHGPIHIKKRLFEKPLLFGTLPAGTRAPRQLEPYSHLVENRSNLDKIPHFIRPEPKPSDEDEFLPAYDGDNTPPDYNRVTSNDNDFNSVHTFNVNLTTYP